NTIVVIPEGKVALGKIAQAIVYGAKIISIQGNFDDALKIVRKIAENNEGVTLVNSVNPYRIECQKTSAFEIVDALDDAPDYLFIPVGNAGNISAYWKGFKEYNEKKGSKLPKMFGYEAEGSAAITEDKVIEAPVSVATVIRIVIPSSWALATDAPGESSVSIDSVTDDDD